MTLNLAPDTGRIIDQIPPGGSLVAGQVTHAPSQELLLDPDTGRVIDQVQPGGNLVDGQVTHIPVQGVLLTPDTGRTIDQTPPAAGVTVGTTAGTVAAGDDSRILGAAQKAANLSDLANAAAARANLGLGSVDNVADASKPVSTAQAAADLLALRKTANLSDLASPATARTNLGLGGAATLAVGTTAGTVAAGDDSRLTGGFTVGTTAGTVAAGDDARIVGAAQKAANLSDLAAPATARANLGLGSVDNTADASKPVSTAQAAADLLAAKKASNLSDLASAATARTNLGLGGAATLAVGTAAGTVAAGDDTRITGSAQKASNLSDLASTTTARTNLGLGGAATLAVGTAAGTVAAGDDSRITGAAQKASNLSDLASAATARTNLGLGNVDNVADASKPVSTAQAAADLLALKKASNLSDLASTATAVANLGLGLTWAPADHGFLTWAYDVAMTAGTSTPLATAGTMYVTRLHNRVATSVTNIHTYITTVGATLTSGQCFAALYRASDNALLGTTADQSVAWVSLGLKTMAIVGGPVAAAAGDLYVALWFNGTTGPAPNRAAGLQICNANLATAASRWATADTGRTTTAPGTLGTLTASGSAYWAALS